MSTLPAKIQTIYLAFDNSSGNLDTAWVSFEQAKERCERLNTEQSPYTARRHWVTTPIDLFDSHKDVVAGYEERCGGTITLPMSKQEYAEYLEMKRMCKAFWDAKDAK